MASVIILDELPYIEKEKAPIHKSIGVCMGSIVDDPVNGVRERVVRQDRFD